MQDLVFDTSQINAHSRGDIKHKNRVIGKGSWDKNRLFQVKSQHNWKIVRRRWIEELLLTVVNSGRNGSNRCAINETGYASGNSRKGSIQVRNSRKSNTQVAIIGTTTYKSVVIEAIARNDWSITSCSLGTTSPAILHWQTTKKLHHWTAAPTEPWRLPNCGAYRVVGLSNHVTKLRYRSATKLYRQLASKLSR